MSFDLIRPMLEYCPADHLLRLEGTTLVRMPGLLKSNSAKLVVQTLDTMTNGMCFIFRLAPFHIYIDKMPKQIYGKHFAIATTQSMLRDAMKKRQKNLLHGEMNFM